MSNIKSFFDIHLHAMDLSHPNLLAFIRRLNGVGFKLILGGILEPLLRKKRENILNLLTVMENSIEDYFILLEYYLKNKEQIVDKDNTFIIDDEKYNRIVITPLLMDFGYKNIKENTFYNIPPKKPIVEQTVDVLNAIKKYTEYYMGINNSVPEISKRNVDNTPLFEIYPFLGINTHNYTSAKLMTMLNKYFGNYSRSRNALYQNMGRFDGNIENVGSNFFAGIKLYPPLGFDPWPDDSEIEKVKMLYQVCEEKRIPLTVHCSDGGFSVDDKAAKRTNPEKWEKVLSIYPNLILNLAHLGMQSNRFFFFQKNGWRNKVINLIKNNNYVYTDFSCAAHENGFYKSLSKILNTNKECIEKIMFGSDYMINLIWSKSYNSYLNLFFKTSQISKTNKQMIGINNPEKFLFG